MSNIPTNSTPAQRISEYQQGLATFFTEPEQAKISEQFFKGVEVQNTFFEYRRKELAKLLSNIDSDEFLLVELRVENGDVFETGYAKIKFSSTPRQSEFDQGLSQALEMLSQAHRDLVPVLFVFMESREKPLTYPPIGINLIEKPFIWGEEKKKPVKTKPNKPKEQELEKELLEWLFSYGIEADNQVTTSKHRTDIWIPSKCFLELKRDKVTGDDVCQAIEYCVEHKMPIIVVGNSITDMASRGIVAFNKTVEGDLLCFVQWSAIKVYLKGLLGLR